MLLLPFIVFLFLLLVWRIPQAWFAPHSYGYNPLQTTLMNSLWPGIEPPRHAADWRRLLASALHQPVPQQKAFMDRAHELAPADVNMHLTLASYWLALGDPARAVSHCARALALRRSLAQRLFPALAAMWREMPTEHYIDALRAAPQHWWPGFFSYATKELPLTAGQTDELFRHMKANAQEQAVVDAMREQLVAKLKRDKLWAQAYISWLNGLSQAELRHAGWIFDGGFESPRRGGFAWNVHSLEGVQTRFEGTFGAGGVDALHVNFIEPAQRFFHLYQAMALPEGGYRLRGRVRVDHLRGGDGVRWQLHCAGSPFARLGESEVFHGAESWRAFEMTITVPRDASCTGQRLHLVSAGETPASWRLHGEIWFDDLLMEKL